MRPTSTTMLEMVHRLEVTTSIAHLLEKHPGEWNVCQRVTCWKNNELLAVARQERGKAVRA